MSMSQGTAERWVVISALVVAGVYAYRRIVEPVQTGNLKNIIGIGNPVPLGQFATAWGTMYLVIAIMASAAPGLGGGFAILVMTGDLLTNTANLTADLNKQQGTTTQAATGGAATTTTGGASNIVGAPANLTGYGHLSPTPPTPLPK
jgi:hypothetical protein